MNMKLKLSILSLILALAGLAQAGDSKPDPSGVWKWAAPANPDGVMPQITFTLKAEGGTVTGTRATSKGTIAILTNGVINGDDISFQTPRHTSASTPAKTSYLDYHGKLAGDTITGTEAIYINEKKFSSRAWEIRRAQP
jgi:hypothetical protein